MNEKRPPSRTMATRYIERAEELRAVAAELKIPENQALLIRTAEEYERLAAISEETSKHAS